VKLAIDLRMTSPAALGRSLRALRRQRGLTQAEVADQLGLQRSYLSQIENGDVRPRDVIGLLRELGEDCAGAVMALPEGMVPPVKPSNYRPLTNADLRTSSVRSPLLRSA
jgi:transcriptional regulator with XRE-family HTH domain